MKTWHPETLTALRVLAGCSQAELSRRSGLSQGHISELERGAKIPRPQTVKKLAHSLGVPVPALLCSGGESITGEDKDLEQRVRGIEVLVPTFLDLERRTRSQERLQDQAHSRIESLEYRQNQIDRLAHALLESSTVSIEDLIDEARGQPHRPTDGT